MFRAVPDKMLVVESDGGTLVDVWIHGDEVTISLDETEARALANALRDWLNGADK